MEISRITEVIVLYYSCAFVCLETFSFSYEHQNCLCQFRHIVLHLLNDRPCQNGKPHQLPLPHPHIFEMNILLNHKVSNTFC